MVDHQRVILDGAKALNEALRLDNSEGLQHYLSSLEFEPEKSIVQFREERIKLLKETNAPSEMLDYEISALANITGHAYTMENTANRSMDELRELLVNLFIPWSGFDVYFHNHQISQVKEWQ